MTNQETRDEEREERRLTMLERDMDRRIWAALEPYLESHIDLDLNNPDENVAFFCMVDDIAASLEIAGYRKHPEPEWEYGRITKTQWSHPRMDEPSVTVLANTEGNVEYQRNLGYMIVRRVKAGPWEAVE